MDCELRERVVNESEEFKVLHAKLYALPQETLDQFGVDKVDPFFAYRSKKFPFKGYDGFQHVESYNVSLSYLSPSSGGSWSSDCCLLCPRSGESSPEESVADIVPRPAPKRRPHRQFTHPPPYASATERSRRPPKAIHPRLPPNNRSPPINSRDPPAPTPRYTGRPTQAPFQVGRPCEVQPYFCCALRPRCGESGGAYRFRYFDDSVLLVGWAADQVAGG